MKQILIILMALWCGILPMYSQSYNEYVRMALGYMAADSLEAAEQAFLEALKAQPRQQSNAKIHYYIGRIQEQRGQYGNAIDCYTKGLEITPRETEIRKARANAFLLTGQEGKALSDYSDILKWNTNDEDALFMRAYVHTQLHLYSKARHDYENLLAINPGHDKARVGLVLLNEKDNRPREAMEQINAMIETSPKNALFYAVRAGMEQTRKQYEAADIDFAIAISLEPGNADFLMSRASMYIETGKKKEARNDLKKALELGANPQEVASMMHLLR